MAKNDNGPAEPDYELVASIIRKDVRAYQNEPWPFGASGAN